MKIFYTIGLVMVISLSGVVHANDPAWHKIAYQVTVAEPSLSDLASKHHALFAFFVGNALHGKGKKDFETVSKHVKNKIQWKDGKGKNAYNEAFVRSVPFVKSVDLQGMPDSILLIPYLESQWHPKLGEKSGD